MSRVTKLQKHYRRLNRDMVILAFGMTGAFSLP